MCTSRNLLPAMPPWGRGLSPGCTTEEYCEVSLIGPAISLSVVLKMPKLKRWEWVLSTVIRVPLGGVLHTHTGVPGFGSWSGTHFLEDTSAWVPAHARGTPGFGRALANENILSLYFNEINS